MGVRDLIRPLRAGPSSTRPRMAQLAVGVLGTGAVKRPAQRHVPRPRAPPRAHRRADRCADRGDGLRPSRRRGRAVRPPTPSPSSGCSSVPPTALAGLSDWSDTVDAERRLGLVHALGQRRQLRAVPRGPAQPPRRQPRQPPASSAPPGWACLPPVGTSAATSCFGRGMGVDHTVFDEAPTDWTRGGSRGGRRAGHADTGASRRLRRPALQPCRDHPCHRGALHARRRTAE